MKLFIYQGASLFPGVAPGATVVHNDVTWTVSEQGHLEAEVPDAEAPVIAEQTSAAEQTVEE